ncbi:uncharacterized protein DS421_5g157230 [Arachis hypogaea]|nr:uncharacterized protein DS421_5g157230 [Arachis hypogaea]
MLVVCPALLLYRSVVFIHSRRRRLWRRLGGRPSVASFSLRCSVLFCGLLRCLPVKALTVPRLASPRCAAPRRHLDSSTSALGAILHVISTSLLGITAITMANTIAGEETVYKLASMLLVVLGGGYVILFLNGKGGHSHSHNQPMEKMVVAGLILVPAFCLLVLRRFRYFSPRLAVTSTHQLSERSSSTKLFSFLEPNLSHSTLLAGYFSKHLV